jgi:hypothetical protein
MKSLRTYNEVCQKNRRQNCFGSEALIISQDRTAAHPANALWKPLQNTPAPIVPT